MSEFLAWTDEEIQLGFQEPSQYFNAEKFTVGEPSQYFNAEKYTTADPEKIISFPFSVITEVWQATKTYAEKAIETAKNIVEYPYEAYIKTMTAEKPTGIIKDSWEWSNLVKPPYIYFLLGIFGLWAYSVFKKR